MDSSYMKKNWKYKLLGIVIFSTIMFLSMYLLKDDELHYIIYGIMMYSAIFVLIWVVPISLVILFIETKIHLISDSAIFKTMLFGYSSAFQNTLKRFFFTHYY
jgi:hypothetical protein